MRKILNFFFCQHLETIRKHNPKTGRFYLECLYCSWESDGVLTGPANQCYNEPGFKFEEEL